MVWPAPEYFAADDAALNLASRILTDGLSSRLNKALVYDKPLCTAVNSFPLGVGDRRRRSSCRRRRAPKPSLAEVERIVTEQIALLAKTGPTQAELDRARTKQEFEFISGLERIGGFGGKADLLNQYNVYLGDPGKFEADMARYRKLTVGDVRAAVDRWLNTRNRLLIRFHPETSGRPAESTLDRSKQPAFGEDRPFKAPAVQTAKLENGLELFVVERSDLPKVAMTVRVRAPARLPIRPARTASRRWPFAPSTWARRRARRSTSRTRSAISARRSPAAPGREYSFAQLRSAEAQSRRRRSASSPTSCSNATFPEAEVDREKKRQLDALAQQEKNGRAIASRVRGHPRLRRRPSVRPSRRRACRARSQAITRDDLVAFHRDRWKPGSSAIVFVGGVTLAEATALAQQHFGAWTGGAAAPVTIPAPQAGAGRAGSTSSIDRTRRRPSSSSSCRRRAATATTTTRCCSPTRSGAAAASARAST